MKHRINVRGVIIPNDYKSYYDYFGEDSTCPKDVQKVIDAFQNGDEIEVYINSPGGVIASGSEIYTLLRANAEHTKIYITGNACSAASVIAMAAYCEMSPTALMMVHCVSTSAQGNHNDMAHAAETLHAADRALSAAYVAKTGMSETEVLEMMNHETWMNAEQAKEKGLIDAVMFEEKENHSLMVDGPLFALPDKEKLERVHNLLKEASPDDEGTAFLNLQAQLNLLRMRGERE